MPGIIIYMIASIIGVVLLAIAGVIYSAVKKHKRKK